MGGIKHGAREGREEGKEKKELPYNEPRHKQRPSSSCQKVSDGRVD